MRLSTQSLARASSRHPGRTIGLWILGIVVSGLLIGTFMKDATTTEADFTNTPEAKEAAHLIEDRLRGPERDREIYIVSSDSQTVDSPAFRAYVERLRSAIEALGPEVVQGVQTFYDAEDASLVSEDRRTTILPTLLTADIQDAVDDAPELRGVIEENQAPGFRTQLYGTAALNEDLNKVAEEDLRSGESIGVLAALVILVVVFGALVAALLPIAIAVAAITMAIAVVAVAGQITQFSFFVTNMITMMGLAVGIDYSLFVVSRYREERHRGLDTLEAVEAAGATASRAVLFSGLTVVLALLGMILIPSTIFRSLASGAIFVVLIAVFASLTLLPAFLGLLGDRVNRLAIRRKGAQVEPGRPGGFWDRVSRGVMHRPVMSLVVGVVILLGAAYSWTDMRTGFSGVSTLPASFESKQAFDTLARDFSGGLSTPVEIAVDGRVSDPAVEAGIQRLRDALGRDPFFGPSQLEVNDAGDLAVISAPMNGDPSSKQATDSISRIRSQYVEAAFPEGSPAEVYVGGVTAFNKDFFDLARSYMPIVFMFVLGLSFVLLTVAFRSIVVPVKAILLNLLSVGAAYGLIVLVSQKGVGAGILGFQQVDTIEAWLPLFLFSVLFGLSMDYHVFLLSRIREHYDLTGDNTESVAYGVRTTAGIITGAALIMVAVFGGFASGRLVMFQQMGFGLAVAVLIDATLIRTVLVPASMRLLGDRNWYLPRWLQWLPNIGVEGPHVRSGEEHRPAAPAASPDGQVPARTSV
ncbi:MAG TPA: MMPL family transporter [Acidimicrobiales bacterium]|nr:MMPL family transporter [Acidimicrobiales bacterium]